MHLPDSEEDDEEDKGEGEGLDDEVRASWGLVGFGDWWAGAWGLVGWGLGIGGLQGLVGFRDWWAGAWGKVRQKVVVLVRAVFVSMGIGGKCTGPGRRQPLWLSVKLAHFATGLSAWDAPH